MSCHESLVREFLQKTETGLCLCRKLSVKLYNQTLRHYAKRALTPRSLNVKLGPQRSYHKGRAAIRHYANQPAHPF